MTKSIVRRTPNTSVGLSVTGHPVLDKILAARGVTNTEQMDRALSGLLTTANLSGAAQAAECIYAHIKQQDRIVIIGDFDADGATSVTLCMLALKEFGAQNLDFLVPNRFDFGYGLSPQIVDIAHQQGAQLIITVDNGISCVAGVERANELGIEVVVTDHHLAGESVPNAKVIVNPNQKGCQFPSKALAGVGVAFYVLLALRQVCADKGWFQSQGLPVPKLANFLDIVALGTVADVVPLDDNNRILVHQGLQRIRGGVCRPGILALLDIAKRNHQRVVASDMGFAVGPRLNAAGRLDDMTLGIKCLMAENIYEARMLASQLDQLNVERREIEASMKSEALAFVDKMTISKDNKPNSFCLFEPSWHQGVIGILAGRIKDKYFRPTIVFAEGDEGELKGSARSIAGIHIRDTLEAIDSANPGLIKKFGGHAMAAGLSISAKDLDVFRDKLEQVISTKITEEMLQEQILSDGELSLQELNLEFAQSLRDLGPWGQSFPEPIFDGHFKVSTFKALADKHLKMIVEHESGLYLDAIAFNVDWEHWRVNQGDELHLAYRLDINEFRGQQSLQLMIEH